MAGTGTAASPKIRTGRAAMYTYLEIPPDFTRSDLLTRLGPTNSPADAAP